jgi:hypothetical protein
MILDFDEGDDIDAVDFADFEGLFMGPQVPC